ncbi:MAG: hypothetical protein CMP59_02905 [Flavobacteriales bacterium]|nr:hypothetical protein [Flavobacteriales bacterium]
MMNKKIVVSLVVGVMLCPIIANAQFNKLDKRQKKTFLEAESLYQYGDYLGAIKSYKEIEEASKNFPEVHYYLGSAYFNLDRFAEARPYLEKGADFKRDALYLIAEIHLYNEELNEAMRTLVRYESQLNDIKDPQFDLFEIEYLKNKIKTAQELMSDPEVVNILNLGPEINSEEAEYGPLISSDESILIYTSRRLTEENKLDPTGEPFENIYYSEKSKLNTWLTSRTIGDQVNTDKHDAAVGLSPSGDRLFVFRSNENLIGGDIYESLHKDGKWTTPVIMPNEINNFESIEPSASMSLDGRTFYFSSNREGGYGGFDIYRVVKLPDGSWSLPKNLGPVINTPYNDDGPFVHPDGKTLYFSSEGHKNMGGFDIFKSSIDEEGIWSEPENLGYPTNTTKDDVFFVISANEQHGYYSSDKAGGFGSHDIYMIDYLEKRLRSSVIRGIVKDSEGNAVKADISVINPTTGDLEGVYISSDEDGSFIFLVNPDLKYDLIIKHPDYEEYIKSLSYSTDELLERQEEEFILESAVAVEQ